MEPSPLVASDSFDLFDELPDAVLVVDREWKIRAANAEARRLLLIGDPVPDFWLVFSSAIEQSRDGIYRQAMSDGLAMRFEQQIGDGWFAARLRPIPAGMLVNLTEIKRTDEAVLDREKRYRVIFERSPQPIFAYDVHTLKLMVVNDACCKQYGYTRGEMLEMTAMDLVLPEDRPGLQKSVQDVLPRSEPRTGVVRHMTNGGGVIVIEYISHWFFISGKAMRVVAAVDATRRLQAEQALRASESLYRTLGEAMPQLVWSMNGTGKFDYVTNRFTAITGLTARDMALDGWAALVHPDDLPAFLTRWHEDTHSLTAGEMEMRCRSADGTYRWYLTRIAPLKEENGAFQRWVGVAADIDELKQTQAELRAAKEAAETANTAKDQFLAVLSHELRTPLTPVLLTASSLVDDPELPAPTREALDMICQQVELEARLIDDLLDLTRIARGKFLLTFRNVDASEIVQRAIHVCRSSIDTAGVRLHVDLQASHGNLWADPTRLQQLLCNLLSNAAKFTPTGGEVHVRMWNEPHAGRSKFDQDLVIEVKDTGVGIEAEALPRIFNAFEQGERSITRRFGGLGLGLTIGKAIAEIHGGSLSAFSLGKDHGAVLTLRLPVSGSPPVDQEPKQLPSASHPHGAKVLVVDDHLPTLKLMVRLIESLGHQVQSTDNAETALAMAKMDCPDLLISDIGMPNQSGWSLLKLIRQVCAVPPVAIAVSGYGTDDDIRRSKDAGFVEHLVKPIDLTQLRDAINHVLTPHIK